MIAILVCDRDERERELLDRDCREQVAGHSDEELRLDCVPDDDALARVTEAERLINLLYYSFQRGQSIQTLREFRKRCGGAMLMLITDSSVSPLEYLRPGVAPDALILRPLDAGQLREVNREFVSSFLERFQIAETEDRFLVDTREEKTLIAWSNIYYFEARDKKIFLRTRYEEYAFYDTMERLESRLPNAFRRCHRSYIVNTDKITRMIPSDNYLELADRLGVPLSRGYRRNFREFVGRSDTGASHAESGGKR